MSTFLLWTIQKSPRARVTMVTRARARGRSCVLSRARARADDNATTRIRDAAT